MNAVGSESGLDLSFPSIYQEHFPMIFRFGFRLLGDPEQAMDLSQEVFLRLYTALAGGTAIREIKSWLFRTASNLGYDWLRRKRRHANFLRAGFEDSGVSRDVEGEFVSSEEARAVRASMDRLAPKDRLLLTLYSEGLPYKGIAQAMDLRETSVGKLLARAIQRLSKEFKEGVRK